MFVFSIQVRVSLISQNGGVTQGTGVILQITRDRFNPARNGLISWVNHLELNYDMTLVISMYIVYLYCIHIIFYNERIFSHM
jgi:hypothetical protein